MQQQEAAVHCSLRTAAAGACAHTSTATAAGAQIPFGAQHVCSKSHAYPMRMSAITTDLRGTQQHTSFHLRCTMVFLNSNSRHLRVLVSLCGGYPAVITPVLQSCSLAVVKNLGIALQDDIFYA